MTCISSTKFSAKVNGKGCSYFAGKRGLRQENLISPPMFVLVMEYLSKILKSMNGLPGFKFILCINISS